jgi:hypothetical protein
LKRWKREWFVLSADGFLRYFENENKTIAENSLFLPEDVREVRIGACVDAPEGHSARHTITVVCTEKSDWIMCADSLDDALAWQYALEQARVMREPVRQLSYAPPQYIIDALANSE